MADESTFTADELMALGMLAGYTRAEAARMVLDADAEKRRKKEELDGSR